MCDITQNAWNLTGLCILISMVIKFKVAYQGHCNHPFLTAMVSKCWVRTDAQLWDVLVFKVVQQQCRGYVHQIMSCTGALPKLFTYLISSYPSSFSRNFNIKQTKMCVLKPPRHLYFYTPTLQCFLAWLSASTCN